LTRLHHHLATQVVLELRPPLRHHLSASTFELDGQPATTGASTAVADFQIVPAGTIVRRLIFSVKDLRDINIYFHSDIKKKIGVERFLAVGVNLIVVGYSVSQIRKQTLVCRHAVYDGAASPASTTLYVQVVHPSDRQQLLSVAMLALHSESSSTESMQAIHHTQPHQPLPFSFCTSMISLILIRQG
jgi:hypothetical protein